MIFNNSYSTSFSQKSYRILMMQQETVKQEAESPETEETVADSEPEQHSDLVSSADILADLAKLSILFKDASTEKQ